MLDTMRARESVKPHGSPHGEYEAAPAATVAGTGRASGRLLATSGVRRALAPAPTREIREPLAELSHELKQPLTVLRMNLQYMSHLLRAPRPDVGEVNALLAECHAAERSLIEMLDRANAPCRPAPARRRRLELNQLARAVGRRLSRRAEHRPVRARLATPSPEVSQAAWPLRVPLARLADTALRMLQQTPFPGRDPTIETGLENGHAELRIAGLSPSMLDRPMLWMLLEHANLLARRLNGAAGLIGRDGGVVIVIALPAASAVYEG